ncbi:MAG TPA: Ig-like domain-containing protein [bacterium]|nr:Ig-like domain-containing protein [bacterium]
MKPAAKILAAFLPLLATAAPAPGAAAAEISVRSMPPVVVATVPVAGALEVDPSLGEIKVTFSKDMQTERMWSWVRITRETFPEIEADKIHYLPDRRTCVLPVRLEPGRTYAMWINSLENDTFRDTENNPAVPYLLVFRTASDPRRPDAPAVEEP